MTLAEELCAIERELDRMQVMLSLDLHTKNSVEQKYVQYLRRIVNQSFGVMEDLRDHFNAKEAQSKEENRNNEDLKK